MLGMIPALKYTDHDIIDENKFLELIPSKFLMKFIISKTHMIIIKPQVWDRGLHKEGLIKKIDIPHFGPNLEINAFIKMLLSCVHGKGKTRLTIVSNAIQTDIRGDGKHHGCLGR
jgi:hypothetical protein